jgi:hypothetical protein
MNVNGMSPGAPRGVAAAAPVQPVTTAQAETRDPRTTPLIEIDKKTQQPVPLRFPWLSRLSTELGQASGQPVPFNSPELGDTLDTRA